MVNKTANRFYDITKATVLVTVEKTFGKQYGENPDDDWKESLYIKPNGEYFVYGEGGMNSPYCAEDESGETSAGSRYEVWPDFNLNNAKNWVHTNCPEKMEEIFMKEIDEDKKTVTTFLLSQKAKKNLKRKARENNMSASNLINSWAESFYN